MSTATVSSSVGNPTRTAGQGTVGLFIVQILEAFNVYHFNEVQTGIAVILFGSLVSFVQNVGENRGWWRPILRAVPPTEVPIVDNAVTTPEQTDNRPRVGDGTLPASEQAVEQWTGKDMR